MRIDEKIENHNERPEVVEARQSGSGEAARDSATVGQKTLYYAMLLDDGRVLRVGHSLAKLWHNILTTLPQILMAAAVLFALAVPLVRRLV